MSAKGLVDQSLIFSHEIINFGSKKFTPSSSNFNLISIGNSKIFLSKN